MNVEHNSWFWTEGPTSWNVDISPVTLSKSFVFCTKTTSTVIRPFCAALTAPTTLFLELPAGYGDVVFKYQIVEFS